VVGFTPWPLYLQGKSPRKPLDRWLGRAQDRLGRRGENSCPYWDSNSDISLIQPIANRYIDYAIPAPNYDNDDDDDDDNNNNNDELKESLEQ
jgi:hypothetical protein